MLLFQAYPPLVVTLVVLGVSSRIVVALQIRTGVLMRVIARGQQVLPGRCVVEIGVGEGAGLDRSGDGPVVNMVPLPQCSLIGGVVGDLRVAGDGVVGTVAVGQDQGVFVGLVLEVVDALI